MQSRLPAVSALIFLLACSAWAATPAPYTVTDLGTFSVANVNGTAPRAINNLGQVTGSSDFDGSIYRAFVYKNGTLSVLGSLGGSYSEGEAINDSGTIAGVASVYGNFMSSYATIAINGFYGAIGTLGGDRSFAAGINASGQIAGSSETAASGVYHSFRREPDGTFNEISAPFANSGTNNYANAISDTGVLVGSANIAGDVYEHAFVVVVGGLGFDLTPGLNAYSAAYALNNAATPETSRVVGSTGSANTERAVIFAVGSMPVPIGSLPGGDSSSRALGVNNAGIIVGFASVASGTHAFIYRSQDASPVMIDLNELIPTPTTIVLTSANGINTAGQICATGYDTATGNQFNRAYLVSPYVAPTPTPTPTPVPAASTVSGKKSLKTSSDSITVKGSASGTVTSVTYKIGSKKGTATGTTSWKFKASKLKSGKNTATVIAHGPGGDSAPFKITITRN